MLKLRPPPAVARVRRRSGCGGSVKATTRCLLGGHAPRAARGVPPDRVQTITAVRRLRLTAAEIAEVLGLALSAVSLWLKRIAR